MGQPGFVLRAGWCWSVKHSLGGSGTLDTSLPCVPARVSSDGSLLTTSERPGP